jgi:hypothetical protein
MGAEDLMGVLALAKFGKFPRGASRRGLQFIFGQI